MFGTQTIGALLVSCALPLVASAQIQVTSMYGPVEIHPVGEPRLAWVDSRTEDSLPMLEIGDRIVTGENGQVTLALQDGSFIVVSANSSLEIERDRGGELRNLMRVFMGKVRFHIQKLGGRPNPYRIHTPTALIAVRGTDFEVRVDPVADATEVRTFEGRVTVESGDVANREVILDAGRKTLVRSGQAPLTPVGVDDEFGASRVFEVVRTDDAVRPGTVVGSRGPAGAIGIDNDRRHRAIDPLANAWNLPPVPSSTRRLKLSYPER
jgi:hypothetical protein